MGVYRPWNGHGIGIIPVENAGGQEDVPVLVNYSLAGSHESAVEVVREWDNSRLAPSHSTVITDT